MISENALFGPPSKPEARGMKGYFGLLVRGVVRALYAVTNFQAHIRQNKYLLKKTGINIRIHFLIIQRIYTDTFLNYPVWANIRLKVYGPYCRVRKKGPKLSI